MKKQRVCLNLQAGGGVSLGWKRLQAILLVGSEEREMIMAACPGSRDGEVACGRGTTFFVLFYRVSRDGKMFVLYCGEQTTNKEQGHGKKRGPFKVEAVDSLSGDSTSNSLIHKCL